MADELEPVRQSFEADLGDYIGPVDAAAADTQGFADVVKETSDTIGGLRDHAAEAGGAVGDLGDHAAKAGADLGEMGAGADDADASLATMAVSEDDATASTEALAESVKSLRDKVYEMYPGIDAAAASLLAEAAAAEAAGHANDEAGASFYGLRGEARGLYDSLASIKDILGAAELGDSITVTKSDMNQFLVETKDEAEQAGGSLLRLTTNTSLLDDAMLKADKTVRDFYEAVNFLGAGLLHSDNIAKDAKNALKDLGATEAEAAAGASALAKAQEAVNLATGAGGAGGGITGLISKMFSGFGGGGSGLMSLLGSVGTFGAGLAVVAPLIYGIVAEVGALINGLGVLGLAVGAFAALAIPSFEQVKNSYQSITTAQANYRNALQLERLDPTKSNAAALATAAAQLKIAYRDVPAYVRPVITDFEQLKATYQGMAKAFEPDVFKVFEAGLRVVDAMLPSLLPLATAAAGAFTGILDSLDKAVELTPGKVLRLGHLFGGTEPGSGSGGFQAFIAWASKMAPPIMKTLGEDLGKLAAAWAQAAEKFSSKDFTNAINIVFDVLIFTLNRVTYAVRNVMNMWDDLSAAFKASRNWFDDATRAVQRFSDNLSLWYRDGERDVNRFNDDLSQWARDAERDFDRVNGDVQNWAGDIGHWMTDAGHGIESAWDSSWSAVVSFARSIPGRIMGALGNLAGLLVHAGEAIIGGFLSGLKSAWGDVTSFVSGIGGWIASHKGPLDYDLVLLRPHGQAIMRGLVQGLDDGLPWLRAQLGLTTGAIAGTMTGLAPGGYVPGLAPAGAGGSQLQLATNVTVQIDSQTLFKKVQTSSRVWNRRNVSNSLTLRSR